jgi:hypothetical protein
VNILIKSAQSKNNNGYRNTNNIKIEEAHIFVVAVASPFLAASEPTSVASPSGLPEGAAAGSDRLSGLWSRRSDSLVRSSESLLLPRSSVFSASREASTWTSAGAVLAPLSAAADVDAFASDLATGGASCLDDSSAVSGFAAGLAGRLSSSYFTSRGLFLFGAATARGRVY